MRICIIDDNVMVLEALVPLLRDSGYEVFSAYSALDGIALMERETPDFLLVDLDLPGMKGDILVSEMRKRHPSLPIILASGHVHPPSGSIGPHGADAFLAKPFTPRSLVSMFLRIQALRDEAA